MATLNFNWFKVNIMYIYLNVWKQTTDVKLWLLYRNTWNYFTVCKK